MEKTHTEIMNLNQGQSNVPDDHNEPVHEHNVHGLGKNLLVVFTLVTAGFSLSLILPGLVPKNEEVSNMVYTNNSFRQGLEKMINQLVSVKNERDRIQARVAFLEEHTSDSLTNESVMNEIASLKEEITRKNEQLFQLAKLLKKNTGIKEEQFTQQQIEKLRGEVIKNIYYYSQAELLGKVEFTQDLNTYKNANEAQIVINSVIDKINDVATGVIIISGHTDGVGTNSELFEKLVNISNRRIEKVKSDLIKKGILESRIKVVPLATLSPLNKKNPSKNENRRVEIRLFKES